MSLALARVTPITVHDPRITQEDRVFPVLKGAEQVLYKQYTTNAISQSSITFHCPPPSANVYVDRRVHIRIPVRVTIPAIASGIVNSKYVIAPGTFGIRSFPVQKAMETIQMTINNQAMSINIGDMLSALELYNGSRKLKTIDYSKCATYPCGLCQEFSNLYATNRSPLAQASDSAEQGIPRNASYMVPVGSNAVTGSTATTISYVDFVSCEPLFLSPLYWGDAAGDCAGFYGVKTMDFTFNFVGNAGNRMICIDPKGIYTSDATARATTLACVADFASFPGGTAFSYAESTPTMLFQYLTPQLVDRGNSMQQILNYPFVNMERYAVQASAIPVAVSSGAVSGTTIDIVSNNVQLNSIPMKLYIFCRADNSQMQKNPFSPDSFLRLNSINLQWGNRSGLLASASKQQLYDISVRAGCTQSYADWAGLPQSTAAYGAASADNQTGLIAQHYFGTGTVLAIDPVDLGLDSIDAPGKLDQITLQVDAKWDWLSTFAPATAAVTMYVVAVSGGVFTLFNGQASSLIGVLNSTDILNSHAQTESKLLNYFDTKERYGGNFLSDLKQGLKGMNKKKVAEGAGATGGMRVARATLAQRLA